MVLNKYSDYIISLNMEIDEHLITPYFKIQT